MVKDDKICNTQLSTARPYLMENIPHGKNQAIIIATWSYEYIIPIKKNGLFLKGLGTYMVITNTSFSLIQHSDLNCL